MVDEWSPAAAQLLHGEDGRRYMLHAQLKHCAAQALPSLAVSGMYCAGARCLKPVKLLLHSSNNR